MSKHRLANSSIRTASGVTVVALVASALTFMAVTSASASVDASGGLNFSGMSGGTTTDVLRNGQVNSSHVYQNVIGNVDAIVKILGISNLVPSQQTPLIVDQWTNDSNNGWIQTRPGPPTSNTTDAVLSLQIDFVENANNSQPVVLNNMRLNAYDIDNLGKVEFSKVASYQLAANTIITVQNLGDDVNRFTASATPSSNPPLGTPPGGNAVHSYGEARAQINFLPTSSFTITMRMPGEEFQAFDFSTLGVGWINAAGSSIAAPAPVVLASPSPSPSPSAAAPGIPGTPTAVAGNASATVSVVAPSSGGAPVSYLVTASNGETCIVTVPATSCTVTNLTNGLSYTFTSTATNGSGTSAASASSNSVTPSAAAPGIPGTPTAVAGNASATVSVVAPSSGGAVTSYTVTASNGATCTVTPPATSCVVSGLTNGTSYTFTSTANNAAGPSAASASSNSVTPSAPAAGGSSVIFRSVSFDANGGVGLVVAVSHAGGTPIPGNAFTRAGHVFTGWNTKQDGSGVTYTNAGTYAFNSDVTLFAQWAPVKAAVKVKQYISTFAGDKAILTPRMKTTISRWMKKLPKDAVITCQGSTSGTRVTAFDKRLAQNRAKNVCNEAVKIRSDLKFSIKLNPSSANKVSARHVWMIQN